jgi:hypothetical protein
MSHHNMNYVVAPRRDLSRQNQNTKFAGALPALYSASQPHQTLAADVGWRFLLDTASGTHFQSACSFNVFLTLAAGCVALYLCSAGRWTLLHGGASAFASHIYKRHQYLDQADTRKSEFPFLVKFIVNINYLW